MSEQRLIMLQPIKKKAKLRVINEGNNRYDISGKLIQLARAIRSGKYGDVSDVIVGVHTFKVDGNLVVSGYHFGRGNYHTAQSICELTKKAMG